MSADGPPGTATISTRASVQIQMPTITSGGRDRADPCTMVICGALGDLSRRKLLPAIYHLMREHLVHEQFAVLGVGRDDLMTDDMFRAHMREALGQSDEIKRVDDELWGQLCPRLFFVSADLTN